jgi:hypothetical protein
MPDRSRQAERLRETFIKQMDAEYAGKVFDIVEEVHLPKGQVYLTKFGRRGRHGWILQDRETGERQVVGWHVLKMIHEWYHGVTLPGRKRHLLKRYDDIKEIAGDQ